MNEKREFEVGDRVWSPEYGVGKVIEKKTEEGDIPVKIITVSFPGVSEGFCYWYTAGGCPYFCGEKMVWFVTALYLLSEEIEMLDGSIVKVAKSRSRFSNKQLVLVRDDNTDCWMLVAYKNYDEIDTDYPHKVYYSCKEGAGYRHCIPYKGNEYLLGTTDSPDKEGE